MRDAPTSTAVPERAELVEPTEQLPVLLAALREPEPGVEDEPLGRDARGDERGDAGRELVAHLGDDVVVLGEGSPCRSEWPRQCIAT